MVLYQNHLLSTRHATFSIPVEDISPKSPLAISRQNNISAPWYLIQNTPHPCNFQTKCYPCPSTIIQNSPSPKISQGLNQPPLGTCISHCFLKHSPRISLDLRDLEFYKYPNWNFVNMQIQMFTINIYIYIYIPVNMIES